MSNAQIKSLNFAVISCFKKIFDVSCTDTAVECLKMFDCCKVAHVIGKRKLKFLQRYARSDSIVCLACNEYLVRDLSLSGRVCGSLSDFVTCVSLICVSAFLSLFKYLATIDGEIKMCDLFCEFLYLPFPFLSFPSLSLFTCIRVAYSKDS